MKTLDWLVIGALLVFSVIPDPSDLLDFGTPIIEIVSVIGYYLWRKK